MAPGLGGGATFSVPTGLEGLPLGSYTCQSLFRQGHLPLNPQEFCVLVGLCVTFTPISLLAQTLIFWLLESQLECLALFLFRLIFYSFLLSLPLTSVFPRMLSSGSPVFCSHRHALFSWVIFMVLRTFLSSSALALSPSNHPGSLLPSGSSSVL